MKSTGSGYSYERKSDFDRPDQALDAAPAIGWIDNPLITVRDLFLSLFRKQECDLGLDLPVRTIYRRKHIVVAAQHEENGLFADLRELPEAAAKRQRPAPAISVPVRRDDRRGAERPSLAEVVVCEWL